MIKKKYLMRLQCALPSCGKWFYTNRYRKYCSKDCAKLANAILGRMRYWEMRKAFLKIRGKIK